MKVTVRQFEWLEAQAIDELEAVHDAIDAKIEKAIATDEEVDLYYLIRDNLAGNRPARTARW
jgi:hypothetical protein